MVVIEEITEDEPARLPEEVQEKEVEPPPRVEPPPQWLAEALARAEDLQLQGNDLCRQGQLPGNAKGDILLKKALACYVSAISILSECLDSETALIPEHMSDVRRRRGTLESNAAQVCLSCSNWHDANRHAHSAMEDDPGNIKSWFRCARADIGLRDWEAAAKTIDEALNKVRGCKGEDVEANTFELWKLAEDVSKHLPEYKWSASKPEAKKPAEDFERRILGNWKYQGGKYEIKIEPWGALLFKEENVKIDLMRKSKLTWRGEWEQIPGMYLILSYEPGCDVLQTQFVPPEEMPEEQKWKGPTLFSATRIPKPPEPDPVVEEAPAEVVVPPKPVVNPPSQKKEETKPAKTPSIPEDAPKVLWLSGRADISGCYELMPSELQNERPVYKRREEEGLGQLFLWYRGGNWGVTSSIHASSLAVPFLARCGDASGRSRHPMEIRRVRWYVRKGRGQEELDTSLSLTETPLETACDGGAPKEATASDHENAEKSTELPSALEVSGRNGTHEEVNGIYMLVSTESGMPVYRHADQHLALFRITSHWVIAPEPCAVPAVIARCASSAGESPTSCRSSWEFLRDQNQVGRLVTMETRTYENDANVQVRIVKNNVDGVGASGNSDIIKSDENTVKVETGTQQDVDTALKTMAGGINQSQWPEWVADASVELNGNEIKAIVVSREGYALASKNLSLDVAVSSLEVGLADAGTLSLALPAAVDTEALPVAKVSERTRTLKIRLTLQS